MHRQTSKKRQLIVRFLIYGMMTTSVIVIVTVLMFVILGYSFNQKDGRIEQGGLIQYSSIPSGAQVTLDELTLGARTPTKSNVEAKSHHAVMDLSGYRSWQKTINVKAGEIGWLSYARLIPTQPNVEKLKTYPALSGALASSDRKWMALQQTADTPTFILADLANDDVKYTTVTIPSAQITTPDPATPASNFLLDSWSDGERYLLVKHTYNDNKIEWIAINRDDPDKSINLTTSFGIDATKVIFGNNQGRTIYVKTDDVIRRVNLDDQTLSRPLVTNVDDFSIFEDTTIIYSTKVDPASDKRSVGYYTDGMENAETVRTYPAGTTPLHMAFGDYFGKRYVAIVHDKSLEVLVGTLPRGNTKSNLKSVTSQTLVTDASWLTISRNGRFVMTQSADGYTTYDLELKKYDTVAFAGTSANQRKSQWIDDYMIWSDRSNMLRLYEFDGGNQQNIMPITEGYSVTLSGNNKFVYGVHVTEAGATLQRAQLILN